MGRITKRCSRHLSAAGSIITYVVIASSFLTILIINTTVIANAITIPNAALTCNVKTYGATGNGTTKDTIAIQKAIDACGGGGTVIFPSGKYLTGPLLLLKNNITLNVTKGATILGSETASDYISPSSQKLATPTLALINSYHINNITITGGGIIDGQGASWWKSVKSTSKRPRLIELAYANNIRINNITLENAGAMHLFLKNTSNVIIDGVTINAPADSPNTDGIVPNSSNNVLIKNCNISVGDDNIAIKGGPTPVPSYNIEVTNCKFGSGHGMSIGTDLEGGIHDVTVQNSTFDGTTNGIRIKADRTSGGKVTAIIYKNLTMTKVKNPIWFSAYYPHIPSSDSARQALTATTPNYSNITVSNLTATGATSSCMIVGLPEMPFSALTLDAVKIIAKKGATIRNAAGLANSGSACLLPPGPPASNRPITLPHFIISGATSSSAASSSATSSSAASSSAAPLPHVTPPAVPTPNPSGIRFS